MDQLDDKSLIDPQSLSFGVSDCFVRIEEKRERQSLTSFIEDGWWHFVF